MSIMDDVKVEIFFSEYDLFLSLKIEIWISFFLLLIINTVVLKRMLQSRAYDRKIFFHCIFQQGNTPLHLATLGNYRHIIEILVQAHCDINVSNSVSMA
jgi:ankyrin repeat protein